MENALLMPDPALGPATKAGRVVDLTLPGNVTVLLVQGSVVPNDLGATAVSPSPGEVEESYLINPKR